MKIQLYNGVKDNIGRPVDIESILQTINGPSNAFPVRKVRSAYQELQHLKQLQEAGTVDDAAVQKQQDLYDAEKRALPAVTWSGTFTKRNAKSLDQYTGLICIDIDKLPEGTLASMAKQLQQDKFTWVLFISPSGNGIKMVYKTDATPERHKEYFLAIEQYLKDQYGIEIDPSGKDINRLCFLSSDKHLYRNEKCTIFCCPAGNDSNTTGTVTNGSKPITDTARKNLTRISKDEKAKLQNGEQTPNAIYESTQQVIDYTEGNRNAFVYKYACNCNRVGIPEIECLAFAEGFAHDLQPAEIKATVNSAYAHQAHEHGKYKRQTNSQNRKNSNSRRNTGTFIPLPGRTSGDNVAPLVESEHEPPYKFWREHIIEKGRGDKKYSIRRLELSRVDFCDFLQAEGFHLLRTGDEEGFQIVHSGNGIIKPITPQQIKHYSLDWCRRFGLKEVEEMLRKGQTKYFAKNELDSLPYKEVTLKRDTYEYSYLYFQNCFVRISSKGEIETLPYENVDGFIWDSNKIKHNYEKTAVELIDEENNLLPYDQINCEFARFIAYCSYNPNNEEERHFDRKLITQRFFAFCSAIGWLLDGFKHPSIRVAIFAVDHKIGEKYEANGRTGKSMIPQACERMKKVANISGKSYDPKYQFCDEPITVDSQIINFNDMQRNFDVENIFEKIADPYSVNRRNQGFIHFKYINSPKIYYSTNFIPKGDGESYKSRMKVIEFSDYFSSTHTPYDEFGHGFFDESWNEQEWQRFYNFMVWCVAYYKEYGLVDYPQPNIEARKLINDVVPEFIDFMEDPQFVPKNTRLEKIKVMEKFNEQYMSLYGKKLTAHSFTSWLRKFCNTKKYTLNPKQKGKYDKSNSTEYITIADANWQDQQTKML